MTTGAGGGSGGRGPEMVGRELAAVPDAERWQRIADLAGAHSGSGDVIDEDEDAGEDG